MALGIGSSSGSEISFVMLRRELKIENTQSSVNLGLIFQLRGFRNSNW